MQVVLKQGMGEATQRLWAERTVGAVDRAFPSTEFSNWLLCERLLSQAHAIANLIEQWGFEFSEAARLINDAGLYYQNAVVIPMRNRFFNGRLQSEKRRQIWNIRMWSQPQQPGGALPRPRPPHGGRAALPAGAGGL